MVSESLISDGRLPCLSLAGYLGFGSTGVLRDTFLEPKDSNTPTINALALLLAQQNHGFDAKTSTRRSSRS